MLYLVPTPIGNLGDITLRAVDVLREVDVIAAEDTRHTRRLLDHLGIGKPVLSYHEHNEIRRASELADRLAGGQSVALVSDAGTPSVSDPGFRILRVCIERGLEYTVLPGASALTVAVAGSGFGGGRFYFGGFLPVRSGQRGQCLARARERLEFSVFFESPHRLVKSLGAAVAVDGDWELCVCRELSKRHEEYRRGAACELLAHYTGHPPKGEIVLVCAGRDTKTGKEAGE